MKRERLTELAKADPYHDFGSVFYSWYNLKQPNKDIFLEGLPTDFPRVFGVPKSEDESFSMIIVPHTDQDDNKRPKHNNVVVDIDFTRLFTPLPLQSYHMMKINSACKDVQNPAPVLGSADPCLQGLQGLQGTNCIYYKKSGVMDLLDRLQEKLVRPTDAIEISNYDGERYSVKAQNSHIYTKKVAGTIHRSIFRYTEKQLINAYDFLRYFDLLGKKIVLVVDATAISIIEILQNLPTDQNELAAVLATRIYFAETVETASDSATKSSATDGQFSRHPHILSCYTASGPVETVTYNWNTHPLPHNAFNIGVSGGKKSGGAMTQRIPTWNDGSVGPYQTADTAWPSQYQFEISSRMENGKLAASLVVKDGNNIELDTIADAEKENNITAVTSKFKKHMGKTTSTDKQKTNIALQQKRSGDWLQVLYCLMAKLRGFKRVDGTPITDIDNVYLLTHDRIALAYGLEMGIDCFFTHGSTGSIWLFEQLRMPEKIARIIIQNREAYHALYRIINPQALQALQVIPFPTLQVVNGIFTGLQEALDAQKTIKRDFLRRHTQAAAGAAAGNTLVGVFDELSVFPLQACATESRRWNKPEVDKFNDLLKRLFRMLWKINDVYKRHPVLLQYLRYDPFTQPLFDRVNTVMTDLSACTGVIRGLPLPQQLPTDDVLLFTETQPNIIARIGEAQAQAQAQAAAPAPAQAPAQEALKRLPELIGQLTECCASVERPLTDMQKDTELLNKALAALDELDFTLPIQGGRPPEVALETFDMDKIKSGYPLNRSGPEFSLLGANIISFLPELSSLPNEIKQFIDARLEEFLRKRVEDLQDGESAQQQWKNAVRALIRAMRVYIAPQAPGGAVVGGALAGEKGLTRRRQGKQKGNTRKVYRGGNPRIDTLMNEFHRQLIKYVFYLIQNLNNGELVELDTSRRNSSDPSDKTIYGYKAESPTVLYKSLIRLVELIKREHPWSVKLSSSGYSGCILIIALLELYNEISNQGKSFYDNLDYDIYIDYFLFLYAKLNGKRATNYFNDKVKKLYRILNNKIISNHFDSFSFSTNRNSGNIHDSIIYQANSGYLKELCLIEICKHVPMLSIQPNRFSSLSRVFECTEYYLRYTVYQSEYLNLGAKMEQLQDEVDILTNQQPRPQQRIAEVKKTIDIIIPELHDIRDVKEIAKQELSRILGSKDYSTGIHKVLNDCVEIENDREYLEQNSQDYESTPKKSKGSSSLQKYITPLPGVPAPSGIGPKLFPPPPDDDNKPPPFSIEGEGSFSLGKSTTSSTSGRGLKRTEKIRPAQSSKGGRKTIRKKI